MSATGVAAVRPEVLPLLVSFDDYGGHCIATFRGTPSELIAAGLVNPAWLTPEFMGTKNSARRATDEFGNSCYISKRARGRFQVEIWSIDDAPDRDGYWNLFSDAFMRTDRAIKMLDAYSTIWERIRGAGQEAA